MLLFTHSGLDQLVPALALALFVRRWVGLRPILAGLVVGEVVVVVLTFGPYAGTVNEGLIALVPNIVVVALGALVERRPGGGPREGPPSRTAWPNPPLARRNPRREGNLRADRATEGSPRARVDRGRGRGWRGCSCTAARCSTASPGRLRAVYRAGVSVSPSTGTA